MKWKEKIKNEEMIMVMLYKRNLYTNVGADFIQFSKNKKPQISNRMTKMSLLNSSNYTIKIHHHILFFIWPCRFKAVKAMPIAYCWARLRFQFEPILNRLMRCNRLLDKDLFKCRLSECWTIRFFHSPVIFDRVNYIESNMEIVPQNCDFFLSISYAWF